MFKNLSVATGLTLLAACGGSSGTATYDGPTIIPFAAAGFATDDSRVAGNQTYDAQNQQRIISDDGPILSLDRQDVEFAIASDELTIDVTIEGVTYTLDYTSDGMYRSSDDDARIEVQIIQDYEVAAAVAVFSVIDGQLNSSNIIIGHDTNPDTVVNLTGSAELNGDIYLEARNGFLDGYASGAATLKVDFDASSIEGEFDLTDLNSPAAEITIPTSSYRLEETPINGNGFSGDITLVSGGIEGTLTDATYDGRFFGSDADTVGGQVSASVVSDDFDNPTYLTGAFIATE